MKLKQRVWWSNSFRWCALVTFLLLCYNTPTPSQEKLTGDRACFDSQFWRATVHRREEIWPKEEEPDWSQEMGTQEADSNQEVSVTMTPQCVTSLSPPPNRLHLPKVHSLPKQHHPGGGGTRCPNTWAWGWHCTHRPQKHITKIFSNSVQPSNFSSKSPRNTSNWKSHKFYLEGCL